MVTINSLHHLVVNEMNRCCWCYSRLLVTVYCIIDLSQCRHAFAHSRTIVSHLNPDIDSDRLSQRLSPPIQHHHAHEPRPLHRSSAKQKRYIVRPPQSPPSVPPFQLPTTNPPTTSPHSSPPSQPNSTPIRPHPTMCAEHPIKYRCGCQRSHMEYCERNYSRPSKRCMTHRATDQYAPYRCKSCVRMRWTEPMEYFCRRWMEVLQEGRDPDVYGIPVGWRL